MVPRPLQVSPDDLKRIPPDVGVRALRDVLYAEARALNLSLASVNAPLAITVRDGGIDAEVNCPLPAPGPYGAIFSGVTCYQIKTGGFALSNCKDVKSILLRPSSLRKRKLTADDLNDQVRDCLDRGGTLVIALFGSDAVDRTPGATVAAFLDVLRSLDLKYAGAHIVVWRANQLVTMLPIGTCLELKGLASVEPFAHARSWMKDCCNFEGQEFLEN